MPEKNLAQGGNNFWAEAVTEEKWEAQDEPVIILRVPAHMESAMRVRRNRAALATTSAGRGLALYEPYGFVTFLKKITRDV